MDPTLVLGSLVAHMVTVDRLGPTPPRRPAPVRRGAWRRVVAATLHRLAYRLEPGPHWPAVAPPPRLDHRTA